MASSQQPVLIATRGSALALAQANLILAQCRSAFPEWAFELRIIKTTGDKLQARPATEPIAAAGKGLFTKELETALLEGTADLAVHSLKDLPTELPEGLVLGAVGPREDVRDVFIYRAAGTASTSLADSRTVGRPERCGLAPHSTLRDLPQGATVATSSTRRQAQVLALRPDLRLVPVRGNVGTRLRKLSEQSELDGLILAAAGLNRLRFAIAADGQLSGPPLPPPAPPGPSPSPAEVPPGLLATRLSTEEMLPCVGQGAIGLEIRQGDARAAAICARLDHLATHQCVMAERVFLHAMGGGCLSPIAAYAELAGDQLRLRAVSFREQKVRRGELSGPGSDPAALGERLAAEFRG